MDVSRPYGSISHPLDSVVLHVLSGTTGGLTGRRIARLTGEGSQQGISKALNRLSEEGIVVREEAGNAILYSLNRQHLAAAAVEQLVNLREELLKRLAQEFAAWPVPPVHASMFGSAARGDGDVRSDIDLFIVRPQAVDAEDAEWRGQIDRLASAVKAWTGNRASVVDISELDLAELSERRPTVVADLEADSIRLAGRDVPAILRGDH